MNIYEVGKMYPEMRNKADSLYLSIDGSGLMLISLLNKPTSKETQAFNRHSDLSVAAGRMFDLLYLCVKFGNLNWMDCTYTPHLGEIPNLPDATDGMGYALHICMFDTSTGVLPGWKQGFLPAPPFQTFSQVRLRVTPQCGSVFSAPLHQVIPAPLA